MNIRHETIAAPKDLASFIEGLWVTASDGATDEMSSMQCCLPNGSWEIIFHLTPQRFCVVVEGEKIWMPELAGFATNSTPVYWQVKGGTVIFGLVLLPETMELLTKRPTLLREARYEDLRTYEQPIFETILLRAKQATTTQKLADVVFATLREYLVHSKAEKHHSYFAEALRLIRHNDALTKNMDSLGDQVFVSQRQLQRTFQEKLGYTPKMYSRMLRFRDAIHFMRQHPNSKMTEIAYDFGYADQSHFIREFKDFTGQNPRSFFTSWKPTSTVVGSHRAYAAFV